MPSAFIVSGLLLVVGLCKDSVHGVDLFNTDECGKSKGCLLQPDNCTSSAIANTNCVYALSYSASNGEVQFELQTRRPNTNSDPNTAHWVAVGFSKAGKMGNTAVTACVWVPRQNRARVVLNYNPGYYTKRIENFTAVEQEVLSQSEGTFRGSDLYCRFRQRITAPENTAEVYNLATPYYLIVAAGLAEANDATSANLKIHDTQRNSQLFPLVSKEMVNLNTVAVLSSAQGVVPDWVKPILFKCHGILMIFGWWLFVPTAIIFARYFRNMWPNAKFMGIKLWFHFHRGLQICAVLQVITAFVCVMVANEGVWVGEKSPSRTHAITGLTCFIAILFEPLFALFRCHPGTKWRPLFNWPHRMIGLTAFCVACTAIWWATNFRMGLNYIHFGNAPRGLMIFYWVILCFVVLALEIHITVTERLRVLKSRKVGGEMPMQPSGTTDPDSSSVVYSPQWATVRGLFLGLFLICAVGVTVTLAVFIGITGS